MITIIIGRAAQFVLALVMLRVATTLLSPEEMGRVSLVLTTIAFFAMFLVNPVGMFINRRLHAWQATGVVRHYLVRYVTYLGMVALIAAVSLLLISFSGWVNFGVSTGWLVVLVCGSLIFNTINQTAIPSLNMLGDSRNFVILSVATLAASFVCAFALVEAIQRAAHYWVLGLLLGQAILAAVGARMLFAKLHKEDVLQAEPVVQGRHLRVLFAFAWPVALAAGLGWVQGQGYRYILEGQLGLAQLGLFVAGYGISAGMIAGFESVLTTYFQPRLYRDANNNQPDEQAQAWQRYATAVIPSLILTVALIVMTAPELTRLLLGENFQAAGSFVIWGALAEAARVMTGVYSLIAHIFMKTRWLILPTTVGAALSILACVLLIPHLGALGAGLGLTLAGFTVVALLHGLLVRRIVHGIPMRAIWEALAAAGVVSAFAIGLRQMLGSASLGAIISVIAISGAAYLVLLYALLRQHLVGIEKS